MGMSETHSRINSARQGIAAMPRADLFAELLSRGWTIPEIRAEMHLTKGAAQGIMTRIRAALGAQAV
jgi:hypothetical protein